MSSSSRERGAVVGALVLLILGIVWFQARGLSSLLGQALTPGLAPSRAPAATAVAAAPRRERSARAILERRPFDSTLAAASAEGAAPPEGPVAHHPLEVPLCADVSLSLVSEERDARESAAILAVGGAAAQRLRPGERLGEYTLVYAGDNPRYGSPAAWLERDGQLCQLLLFRGGVPTPVPAPSAVAATVSERAPARLESLRTLSEGVVSLDRSEVEVLLARTEELAPSERYLVERSGEEVVGMRLFRVTSGGLLAQLGLRSGDRLESVGGVPAESRERLLEGYSGLRTSGSVKLQITRKGAPLELVIQVR